MTKNMNDEDYQFSNLSKPQLIRQCKLYRDYIRKLEEQNGTDKHIPRIISRIQNNKSHKVD